MNRRITALVVAFAGLALALAPIVYPQTAAYHSWQYITAIAVVVVLLAGLLDGARRGEDGRSSGPFALAVGGALVIALAGLASGLLGPDTQTVLRAPGSVAPIPDAGVAAFFTQASREQIARGDAPIVLRAKGGTETTLGASGRRYRGSSVLSVEPGIAAFVDATDAHGDHLTVTQPSGTTFLSPVLLFPNTQTIMGKALPLDTFAVPAAHRIVRAVYFAPSEAIAQHMPGADGKSAAILYAVDDDNGTAKGITIAPSGRETAIGGLRLRATLGTYPRLIVASAPNEIAVILGMVMLLAGIGWLILGERGASKTRPAREAEALDLH